MGNEVLYEVVSEKFPHVPVVGALLPNSVAETPHGSHTTHHTVKKYFIYGSVPNSRSAANVTLGIVFKELKLLLVAPGGRSRPRD